MSTIVLRSAHTVSLSSIVLCLHPFFDLLTLSHSALSYCVYIRSSICSHCLTQLYRTVSTSVLRSAHTVSLSSIVLCLHPFFDLLTLSHSALSYCVYIRSSICSHCLIQLYRTVSTSVLRSAHSVSFSSIFRLLAPLEFPVIRFIYMNTFQ